VRSAAGLNLTARAIGAGAKTISGSEADLDGLTQRSAEAIYEITQPYRYGMYLASHGRLAEAIALFKTLAETGAEVDRPWGYSNWGHLLGEQEGLDAEISTLRQAMETEPNNSQAQLRFANLFRDKGMPERAIREYQKALSLISANVLKMYTAATNGPLRSLAL